MKIIRAIKLVGVAVALAAVVGACSTTTSPTGAGGSGVPTVAPTVVVPATSAPAETAMPSSS